MFTDDVTRGAGQTASCAPVGVTGTPDGSAAAPAQVGMPPVPFRMPLGEWFDEDFDFIGPEGDAFTDALLGRIGEVEKRIRKRKAVDEESHRLLVRKLAVNGYRAFRWFKPARLSVHLGPKAYNGRGGPWLNGEAMGREVALMRKAGLVEVSGGVWREASTTLRMTDAFIMEAMKARLSDGKVIHRLDADRTVRAYRTNSKDGEFIDFEHDDQSRQWTGQLDAYNAFIAKQAIGITLSKRETVQFVARQNAYRQAGTPRLKQPDLTNKSLFRQFNYGGFEAGGRMYGAWWVNCPSDLRPLITINGEATVELDFSVSGVFRPRASRA